MKEKHNVMKMVIDEYSDEKQMIVQKFIESSSR